MDNHVPPFCVFAVSKEKKPAYEGVNLDIPAILAIIPFRSVPIWLLSSYLIEQPRRQLRQSIFPRRP